MRRSIIACGLLLALAGISSAVATAAGARGHLEPTAQRSTEANKADGHSIAYWKAKARHSHAVTKQWLTIVRGRPPRLGFHAQKLSSAEAAQKLARKWHRRANAARRRASNPPELHAWYCIHHYEGRWTDPNAPYWGGLQMDYNFQSAYGAWLLKHKGTADHWAPLAQIWAAVRAWRVRGFEPWSSSAHACGVY
jgi:hypothetical protein